MFDWFITATTSIDDSQTSTPLLGPRCLVTASTNSSGTPMLTPKTSSLQKPSQPGKLKFQRPWIQPYLLHLCQYLLLHLHLPLFPSTLPAPSSPHLPSIIPFLCLPQQLVYNVQLRTRVRNHIWLSPSNRDSPQGLNTFMPPQQREPPSPTLQ